MTSSSATTISIAHDPADTISPRDSSLMKDSSESVANIEYSVQDKVKSGLDWVVDPFRRCCSRNEEANRPSKPSLNPRCLKPELNRVSGLLKYFAFGVMFTNGILGLLVFLIGLWSSFEQRKMNSMPDVNTKESSSLNPFHFLAIILCVFGLLFFLLALISCLGIHRENLSLLRISLISQCLTLVLFLIFAIVILIWADKIRVRIADGMMTGLKSYYHVDEAWSTFFDKLHLNYFCCGVYSFDDWNQNPHYACTSANTLQSFDACSVPFTCCKTPPNKNDQRSVGLSLSYTCGVNILPSENKTVDMDYIHERIHVNGCFDEILPVIQQLIVTAAIFLLLICVIVFVTIFLTCLLSFEIRLTRSNVERYCRKRRRKDEENPPTEKGDDEKF